MGALFAIEGVQAMKARAIELLGVKAGEKVLELGCGLGDDARAFASLVGEEGAVIAVDTSKKMLARAAKLTTAKNIQYASANANHLEYSDASFDVCHADRLLISQMEPLRVIQESIRVLKPGGRFGVTDCDFGSIVFSPHHKKITTAIVNRMQEITQNPLIGRELPALFKQNGLIDIQVVPEPYVVRSFERLNTMVDVPRILKDLHFMGRLTETEAQEGLAMFNMAEEKKEFLYCITFFTVIGRKNK
jgi:SAM-dependent methyltransferase